MILPLEVLRALALRPRSVLETAAQVVPFRLRSARLRRRDRLRPTYHLRPLPGRLQRHLTPLPPACLEPLAPMLAELCRHYLAHRFNLLGSGWLPVHYGADSPGLEGHRYPPGPAVDPDPQGRWLAGRVSPPNLPEACRIWTLVSPGYQPIDWHRDFKSGFRWNPLTWYQDVTYGDQPGADVKLPWELARCQHLPHLALAYTLARAGHPGLEEPEVYLREFRDQVLDFLATNPPRMGVNWACAMEVALRVVSWLVARDLFLAAGAELDPPFESLLLRAVYEHAWHLSHNLEWIWELKGNHYLADVAGLFFAAAYLPPGPESDAWLALGLQELLVLVRENFGPDGGNFEASTGYHLFCAETVMFATALALGLSPQRAASLRRYRHRLVRGRPRLLPPPHPLAPRREGERVRFPSWYGQRLAAMARFTALITRPDGRVPQIGDEDSARFLKLPSRHRALSRQEAARLCNLPSSCLPPEGGFHWEEDRGDHRHLVDGLGGLLGWAEDRNRLVVSLVRSFSRGRDLGQKHPPAWRESPPAWAALPDFGLYVWRHGRLFLCVRCGPVGQNGRGGHAHNDLLSFELCLDGRPLVVDPGTYLYTPLPARRNQFRSTAMHNTPQWEGREQYRWPPGGGLFWTQDLARPVVEEAGPGVFQARHQGFGVLCRRRLEIGEAGLRGFDTCAGQGVLLSRFHLAPGVTARLRRHEVLLATGSLQARLTVAGGEVELREGLHSPGYGLVTTCTVVEARSEGGRLVWHLEALGAA